MPRNLSKHEIGSGNVFADTGRPDAELHLLKAEIVNRIDDVLRERRLTQAAAARLMGIGQPDVSKMLRGLFRGFSLERLLLFLAALGQDVTIDVRRPRGGRRARSGLLGRAGAMPTWPSSAQGECGNKGKRIYHVPGDPDCDQTKIDTDKGERWFCSEAEAEAAGWRRAEQ
jgi:predicted XRE-type DNA-binding protein